MKNVCVVLTDVRNPLNIGAAARAMANFGFHDLRLAKAYRVASEEARSGPNAGPVLTAAQDFPSLAPAIADRTLVIGTTSAAKREVRLPIVALPDAAKQIHNASNIALVFGSEKFGLSNDDMSHCHWLLRIPTTPEVPSMNLGQAVAVVLYELVREPRVDATTSAQNLASIGMCEQLTQRLHEALSLSGYVHTESTQEKLRKLILRMHLREEDAVMWLGMARQLLWRLKSSR